MRFNSIKFPYRREVAKWGVIFTSLIVFMPEFVYYRWPTILIFASYLLLLCWLLLVNFTEELFEHLGWWGEHSIIDQTYTNPNNLLVDILTTHLCISSAWVAHYFFCSLTFLVVTSFILSLL